MSGTLNLDRKKSDIECQSGKIPICFFKEWMGGFFVLLETLQIQSIVRNKIESTFKIMSEKV